MESQDKQPDSTQYFKTEGRNAHFSMTREEGNISNLCNFNWYEWCYYREKDSNFPLKKEILGRVLGPAKGKGNEMAHWILKVNGNVVPRRYLRPLNKSSSTVKRNTRNDCCMMN